MKIAKYGEEIIFFHIFFIDDIKGKEIKLLTIVTIGAYNMLSYTK